MPVWITKKLPISEWGGVQFRVLVLQQELKSPLHLAMLYRPTGFRELDDVFIVLPDIGLMARFPGFAEIAEADIPDGVQMLVSVGPEFEQRFPQVAARIRRDAAA
jgi:hypothetical protein